MLIHENPIVVRLCETRMPYKLAAYYPNGIPQNEVTLEDVLEVNRMLESWDDWDEWSEWVWYPMDRTPHLLASTNLAVAQELLVPGDVLTGCALQVIRFGAVHVVPLEADAEEIEYAVSLCQDEIATADLGHVHIALAQAHARQGHLSETARHLRSADDAARQALLESSGMGTWDRAVLLARIGQGAQVCGDNLRAVGYFEQVLELLATADEPYVARQVMDGRMRVLHALADVRDALGARGEAVAARRDIVELARADCRAHGGDTRVLARALAEHGEAQELIGQSEEAGDALYEAVEIYNACPELSYEDTVDLGRALATLERVRGAEPYADANGGAQSTRSEHARAVADALTVTQSGGPVDVEGLWHTAVYAWPSSRQAERRFDADRHLLAMLNADPVVVALSRDEAARRLAEGGTVPEASPCAPGQDHSTEWYTARRDFFNAILALQAVAAHVCRDRHDLKDRDELCVSGVQGDWFRGLDATLRRMDPRTMAWLLVSWQPGPVRADDGAQRPGVDGHLCIREHRGGVSYLDPGRAIWSALTDLLGAARHDGPPLRRCTMPVGIEKHLDYLLGERESDVPECGVFYIAQRGGQTCGRERCKKANTRLQGHAAHAVKAAKKERAKTNGEREYRKAMGETHGFEKLWQEAGEDFLHLGRLLRGRKPKAKK